MLPLIIELESTSLVPADPIFDSAAAWLICIKHCDRRFRLSLSFLLFGNSPPGVENDVGGGGRGGGL